MSYPAWKTHQLELLKLKRPQPLVDQMFLAQNSENPTQKTPGCSQIEQICCQNNERNLLFDTKKYENKTFKFIDSHALKALVQASTLYLKNGMSRDSIKDFLLSEREKITSLGEKFNFDGLSIAKEIPLSIEAILVHLGISMDFEKKIFCPECFSLYDLTAMGHINKQCTSKFIQPFPSSIVKLGSLSRKECGSLLFKTDDKNDNSLGKPICTFTYQSLQKWLASHMWIPGFEKLLNSQNTHNSQTDPKVISDIWHSKIWHTFKSSPRSKQAFTNRTGNLIFSLYVDWFNPFSNKGAAKSISIGSILLTCLNLPPSERHKEENMFLYAIIPGPKEPSLDQMNSILVPLVIEV
ncbi:hypothetical protein O181_041820 [Austropuccinia psidii MF-1]|uniref:Uncharacterized protein n=1 Tax=Austropuccinia psidii MF-1 TaxID=1389203 RepID=A0A9Q3HHI4_9BASI|nr:hypothetical protein [Austropuccinia psidii MF-1]